MKGHDYTKGLIIVLPHQHHQHQQQSLWSKLQYWISQLCVCFFVSFFVTVTVTWVTNYSAGAATEEEKLWVCFCIFCLFVCLFTVLELGSQTILLLLLLLLRRNICQLFDCLFVYLFVCVFVCLWATNYSAGAAAEEEELSVVCLLVCIFIYLFICLFVCCLLLKSYQLFVCLLVFVCLFVCLVYCNLGHKLFYWCFCCCLSVFCFVCFLFVCLL